MTVNNTLSLMQWFLTLNFFVWCITLISKRQDFPVFIQGCAEMAPVEAANPHVLKNIYSIPERQHLHRVC